jgi:two-component system NtrC family response regulator
MKILFADDEKNIREVLTDELCHLGHTVMACADGSEALENIRKKQFDVLLLDLDMPRMNGLTVLEQTRKESNFTHAVILTGKGTLEAARQAVHYGICEFLTKPYKLSDLEKILNRIAEQIAGKQEQLKKSSPIVNSLRRLETNYKLIGHSPAMQDVYRLINRIAVTDSAVVILGETGTGKELVARTIHEKSSRADKPFVAVNCGALPENLIESELFGHRRGSFTGADSNRIGLVEVADGGTLFLDEIGELPKGVQAKLLRFLECGEVRKIGENNPTICNVRVVCATLRNLEDMVKKQEFREDLWFRINTFEIRLPPLKERPSDIPELIKHFAVKFRPELATSPVTELFTPDTYEILLQYDWPGNVRQLANTIEHAIILADYRFPIETESLPQNLNPSKNPRELASANLTRSVEKKIERPTVNQPVFLADLATGTLDNESAEAVRSVVLPNSMPDISAEESETFGSEFPNREFSPEEVTESTTLRDLELRAIIEAINRHGGKKAKAAEELGVSVRTLYNKLNQSDKRSA